MQNTRLLLVTLALVLVSTLTGSVAGSLNNPSPNPQASVSLHLTLGNPSRATKNVSNEDNFLMVKPQFVLSFNNSKGGPNWVSWHLQASDVGRAKRLNRFHPDTDLPEGFKRVVTGVYTNTGFERGHLCNSEDRTKTQKDNHATFAMTNILPRRADNNKGPWVKLETFSRKLLKENELYLVAGAFGTKGSIGTADRKVNIPRVFWKVVVVMHRGNNDVDRINSSTRTIAICVPNEKGIRKDDWRRYVVTIRQVEAATGYNFLSEVSRSVQDAIETRKDSEGTGTVNFCR